MSKRYYYMRVLGGRCGVDVYRVATKAEADAFIAARGTYHHDVDLITRAELAENYPQMFPAGVELDWIPCTSCGKKVEWCAGAAPRN